MTGKGGGGGGEIVMNKNTFLLLYFLFLFFPLCVGKSCTCRILEGSSFGMSLSIWRHQEKGEVGQPDTARSLLAAEGVYCAFG